MMPSAPNTLQTMQAIKAKIQSLQVNGSTFFTASNVVIGRIKDLPNRVPAAEIVAGNDETKHWTQGSGVVQGGRIKDTQEFIIELSLDYTDAQEAEISLANIRDSLTQAFHTSATLNLQGQVFLSELTGQGERGYTMRSGQTWRVYKTRLRVGYEYAVIVQP